MDEKYQIDLYIKPSEGHNTGLNKTLNFSGVTFEQMCNIIAYINLEIQSPENA